MSKQPRITAVVVTWNRKELLREALWALKIQTTLIDRVVVVDNASEDGTNELLRDEFGGVDVVTMAHNTGGAGGFTKGLAVALEGEPDAVWLMDDDTVPEPSALEAMLTARAAYAGGPLALIASKVVWTDGRDHPMNTPRLKPGVQAGELAAAEAVRCVPIRSASFVSILVDAATVRERGLPLADYFLWNDDFEFTTRLIRGQRALYCPASVVVHKTKTFGATDADPGERFYFEVRNKIWLFGRSRGLSAAEKAVYAGSTLRRWARTIARSDDRGVLIGAAGRGLVDGIRTRPRPADEWLVARQARSVDG